MSLLDEQEYSKRLDFKVWRKLIVYVLPYKKLLIIIAIQMLLVASIDAIFPMLTKIAIDNFIIPHSFKGFPLFCLIALLLAVFQALNVMFMIRNAGKMETSVPYDLRKTAFRKLQELPLSYYDKTPIGWMMARMTSDIKKLAQTLSWNLVDLCWSISMMLLMTIVMFVINLKLALLVLLTVPVLAVLSFLFQQWILNNYRRVRKVNSHIINSFNEGIMGAKTIKTLVREKESLEEFKTLTKDMRRYSIKSATVSSIYTPIVILLASIGMASILWRGGNGVVKGTLSYGTLIMFLAYAERFFDPVKQFARLFSEFQYAQASAERVMFLIETEVDIKDSENVINKFGHYTTGDTEKWPDLIGNISFKNVSFSYKDGEAVLNSFNLEVKAGETIALVGETGSGKTTIVNLACRFYQPTEGSILIDNVDYRQRPLLWLQSNLGYVLQESHLFSGSVKENIAYSKTDATIDEIINAATLVNAHNFITQLENGYDTDVGERGSKLSTGQKQLISFARAILVNPKIFVLDEATSSVDTETEHLIKDAIQNILKDRTSFIIAHRLSTIKSADRILVIEKGEVIESGTHKQLLNKKGYYYRLYTNQFLEEEESKLLDKEIAG